MNGAIVAEEETTFVSKGVLPAMDLLELKDLLDQNERCFPHGCILNTLVHGFKTSIVPQWSVFDPIDAWFTIRGGLCRLNKYTMCDWRKHDCIICE